MAEQSTLARPYAQAVFDLAKQKSQLTAWSETLQLLAALAADESMLAVIKNPNIARDDVLDLLNDLAGKKLDQSASNLLRVLAENRRLVLLPEIAEQYEQLRAEAENVIDAELISAFEVSDEQKQKIADGLKKRLGRDVNLTCTVDPELIGGAMIRAGDLVIDGTMASQLQQMATRLSA